MRYTELCPDVVSLLAKAVSGSKTVGSSGSFPVWSSWKVAHADVHVNGVFQERFLEAVHLVCFECWGLYKRVLGYWLSSWRIATMRLGDRKLACLP